jgi:hypothetical protein
MLSGLQLIEQGLGLLQVKCVEAFSKPAVDRSEQFAGLPVAVAESYAGIFPNFWLPSGMGVQRSLLSQ